MSALRLAAGGYALEVSVRHISSSSVPGTCDDMLETSMTETLAAVLRPGRGPALVSPEDGVVVSHADLAEAVETLAGRLAAAGVERGDRVALVLPNGPEFIQLLLGVAALGAVAAPLNPAFTRDEFAFYLGDLEPRLLLVPANEALAARVAAGERIGVIDAAWQDGRLPRLWLRGRKLERQAAFEQCHPDDVAVLLHTSGTTSRPKQVPLLQRNVMASTRAIVAHYGLCSDDVSYCAMPLFHVHGLVASALAALAAGGSVVVPRRFGPRRFWSQACDRNVTWLSAGPTLHQMVLAQQREANPPSTLRFVRSCSSALSPALMQCAEEAYAAPMLEAYGMTEASHQIASNPLPPAERIAGSVGVPTGTEVAVVDGDLRFLGEGERGEIVIRGPNVTPGYLANPHANEESFFDGWFRTGDWGAFDAGYVRLEGRIKELIIRGGENISPAEIEDVLKAHPAVADAACFGVPDETYGEEIAVAVSLAGEADERTLIAHCRERLTPVKVPRAVYVLPAIPRTATGKLQRRRVAEHVLESTP